MRPLLFGILLSVLPSAGIQASPELEQLIDGNFNFAAAQYRILLEETVPQSGLPRAVEQGEVVYQAPHRWISGFFPGGLWLLYEYTGDTVWLEAARSQTKKLEVLRHHRGTHDLGFMLYNSYGRGYQLTQDPEYKAVLLDGADALASRYSDTVGATKSWDWGTEHWDFPVIIDNMINLEYLFWSGRQSEKRVAHMAMAITHAETTLRNHFRADGSTWHVLDYNSVDGTVNRKRTWQGLSDDSSWSRGQAWAVYGYAMCGRETGLDRYYQRSRETARFLMQHPQMPEDRIPWFDMDGSEIPNAPRDTAAAAVLAAGYLELANAEEKPKESIYWNEAVAILKSLSQAPYRSEPGANHGFILDHATGSYPENAEVDVPIIYADYYFLEALLRLKKML